MKIILAFDNHYSSYYNCLCIKENLEKNIDNCEIKIFGKFSTKNNLTNAKLYNLTEALITWNEDALLFNPSSFRECQYVLGKNSIHINLNVYENLVTEIVDFEPDLVINDLNYNFACIVFELGIPQWYCSPLNIVFELLGSKTFKPYKYYFSKFPQPDKHINYHWYGNVQPYCSTLPSSSTFESNIAEFNLVSKLKNDYKIYTTTTDCNSFAIQSLLKNKIPFILNQDLSKIEGLVNNYYFPSLHFVERLSNITSSKVDTLNSDYFQSVIENNNMFLHELIKEELCT